MLYYSEPEARWAVLEGERVPTQFTDYCNPTAFQETGKSPKERIPLLSDWQEQLEEQENNTVLGAPFS